MGPHRKALCLSILSIAVLILLAIPAIAQMPTATILGVAKDCIRRSVAEYYGDDNERGYRHCANCENQ